MEVADLPRDNRINGWAKGWHKSVSKVKCVTPQGTGNTILKFESPHLIRAISSKMPKLTNPLQTK